MWLRWHDGADRDPLLLHICRTRADLQRHLGALAQLMLHCASQGTNGFVQEFVVADILRSRKQRQLFTDPPAGATPLLHRPGDVCECLDGRPWPSVGDYFLHHYLQWNPTKEEYDVAAAKKAELRDGELIAAIRRRDRDRCRYCGADCNHADRRGAAGLVYDHVDPALAAGAANLVCACRSCNSRKGNRTPDAAGMTLLPPPGAVPGPRPGTDPAPDPQPTSGSAPDATTARARTGRDGTGSRSTWRKGRRRYDAGDAGPTGVRETTGPPDVRPRSHEPDPYRRSAVTGQQPQHHAGLPEEEDYPPPPGGL